MAVIQAQLPREPAFGDQDAFLSPAMWGFLVDYWPPYLRDSEAQMQVNMTSTLPVEANPRGITAEFTGDYFWDFYYRVHIVPELVNLGNVLSTQQENIEVWNAFFSETDITDIALSNASGVSLIPEGDTGDLPVALGPLGSALYQLTVASSGPPTIDATIEWTTSRGTVALHVIGSRLVVFPFAPEWTSGIEEDLTARSQLLRSTDGSEQSVNLTDRFRRAFRVPYQLKGTDAQLFSNLLFGWQSRFFGVPIWTEVSHLPGELAGAAVVIPVDTTYRSFEVGASVMLYVKKLGYVVREIESLTDNSITVKTPVGTSWPAGTKVLPIAVAAISQQMTWQQMTPRGLVAQVQFDCEPSQTTALTPDIAPAETYRGYEIYRGITNWRDGLTISSTSDALSLDSGNDIFSMLPQSGYSGRGRSHDWFFKSLADVYAFRAWLFRRRGRTYGVWMHSAIDDFDLALPTISASSGITVKTNGYAAFAKAHAARRDIYIETYAGEWYARRINDAVENNNGTTGLQLDAVMGVALQPSQIKRFCFLSFYRLSADTNTIRWVTAGKAEATTGLLPTKSIS